ncbi:GPP34 family phosphoprotein [Pseudoclavibacter endophyticus]|uniref:GPP34 family phosphoprotein n=2 Tax=Pseudoclavibacter endophyticus TaxID=1778590 RepID=A0A6H9WN36_9MICO|nr:GPP34 family phosphoprotein [Pseudoclavibacter endophyticus]
MNDATVPAFDEPLLVEDVMLLLFQPATGSIAGENILFYVLAGATLGDLTRQERIELREADAPTPRIHTLNAATAPDPVLLPGLEYIEQKPRAVQTVLAAIGPNLRAPVLDRLVERGDLTREKGKTLGIFPSTKLALGSDRRAVLIERVRSVLTDGETPDARTAVSIALLSASGTLPQFDGEIPWSGDVYTRAKAIERGDWGAAAASEAVTRTMTAVITNALIAGFVQPRS